MSSKKSKFYNGPIPFDRKGNMINYDGELFQYFYLKEYDFVTKIGKNMNNEIVDFSKTKISEEKKNTDNWNSWKVSIKCENPYNRPNKPFKKLLKYKDYGRGRSAAYFIWEDEDEKEYYMFMSDIDDLIKEHGIPKDGLYKQWVFTKRGSNFGVKLYE